MDKKNRINLSTLLTAYHHYQRIFKERREIKIIIMNNLIEAIKQPYPVPTPFCRDKAPSLSHP